MTQLFGLFQFTLPVKNLSQELHRCQDAVYILRRAQQSARLQNFILRIQNPTGVQRLVTNTDQTIATPEHILLGKPEQCLAWILTCFLHIPLTQGYIASKGEQLAEAWMILFCLPGRLGRMQEW